MKRCQYAHRDGVCERPMPKCCFSYDCYGEITDESVGALRDIAEQKFSELKFARCQFHKAVKVFARAEQRLTEKLSKAHILEYTDNPKWWELWRPK